MAKIIPIQSKTEQSDVSISADPNSKDWVMVRSMMDMARKKPQANLVPLELHKVTRKTKLALVMLPEWGIYFPPYNLSRLAGITRAAGFHTNIYDINIKAWQALKDTAPIDYWHPAREWMWPSDLYMKEIHKYLEPVLEEYIAKIVESKPDVVGFCLYYTNEIPTNWMAFKLRKLLPHAKIICGGPQAASPSRITYRFYDHIVQGEGEQILLNILEGLEKGEPVAEQILVAPKTRLDLDSLPFPDYSTYDLSDYAMPNGISSELSRGCVAKCVFCTEVHFWKYRGRMAGTVLDEIEFQYRTHGIDFVWFIDSLVNGNLKELRAFALGVVERGLNIRWQGYSRCDGRMDLEYFKDLAASGCHQLNYGIESGSQKVLDDMRKAVRVEEMEANLRDGHSVGIQNSTNWIIGFPSEDPQAVADTYTFAWRVKEYLLNVSPGITMMLSPGSEVVMHGKKFNIFEHPYQDAWCTEDLRNTKIHRLIRQKSFLMFLQHLNTKDKVYGVDRDDLVKMYDIDYTQSRCSDSITYETFDYDIIKPNINPLADSVVNEIWPLLRTYWRALGPYTITIKYEPKADLREWGDRLACNYTATHNFSIDDNGHWTADFYYKFVQEQQNYKAQNFEWPDYSFEYSWQSTGSW